MSKRIIIAALAALACTLGARAVPAYPGVLNHGQPDGTTLGVVAHGDEFYNWLTTADGLVVTYDARGAIVYASGQLGDGTLTPSTVVAHDAADRSAAEKAYAATQAMYSAQLAVTGRKTAAAKRAAEGAEKPGQKHARVSENYRGLVILVEYKDMPFIFGSEANAQYQAMCGQENYTGYTFNGVSETFTGSVRDYFRDNSMGQFNPPFDVVGPVKIDYSCKDANKTSNAQELIGAALKAADPLVDYSKYDSDNDHVVDMVFFLFSGYGSNYGNNAGYLWPHKSIIYRYRDRPDGMFFGTYACSVERAGAESSKTVDGIGTFCHEFSHVLGLWDEYDTDYEGTGGESKHPGGWSVMAGGSYNNTGRTPVGYSLFQRHWMEFTTPETIKETGSYEMEPLYTSNAGYILPTPVEDEYFTLEYRLKDKKWERFLPGSGMLVYRVDFTDSTPWSTNSVNCNPEHMYLELVRADNEGGSASARDPFPGKGGITSINNYTTPSLRTWAGKFNDFGLQNIAETDGRLTFEVVTMPKMKIEEFTGATVNADGYCQGKLTDWILDGNATIETPDCGHGIDGEAVGMIKNSVLQTVPLEENIGTITVNVYNPNAAAALLVQYSLDDGETWKYCPDQQGQELAVTVGGASAGYYIFDMSGIDQEEAKTIFRIKQYNGSKTKPLYVDNIGMSFSKKTPSGIESLPEDSGSPEETARYDLSGRRVDAGYSGVVVIRHADGTATKQVVR